MYRWLENLEKKKRIFYLYEDLKEGIHELNKHDPSSRSGWIGSFSISGRKAKVYKIWDPLIIWKGYTLIGTEIAKLLISLNNPPKGYRKITVDLLDKTPPPLYADPTSKSFEGVYVDIKACYYTLISKLWGIKYARNLWLGLDKEIGTWQVPEEFETVLSKHKQIRNAIYGLLRAKHGIFWKLENDTVKFTVQKTKNSFFYPDVPLAILDITHAIATVAVNKFSAKYFAIDGAIVPYKFKERFCDFLLSLGFNFGIKAEGWTVIKNFYSYTIGEAKTKTFDIYSRAEKTQSNLLFSLDEAEEILRKFKPLLLRNP